MGRFAAAAPLESGPDPQPDVQARVDRVSAI